MFEVSKPGKTIPKTDDDDDEGELIDVETEAPEASPPSSEASDEEGIEEPDSEPASPTKPTKLHNIATLPALPAIRRSAQLHDKNALVLEEVREDAA